MSTPLNHTTPLCGNGERPFGPPLLLSTSSFPHVSIWRQKSVYPLSHWFAFGPAYGGRYNDSRLRRRFLAQVYGLFLVKLSLLASTVACVVYNADVEHFFSNHHQLILSIVAPCLAVVLAIAATRKEQYPYNTFHAGALILLPPFMAALLAAQMESTAHQKLFLDSLLAFTSTILFLFACNAADTVSLTLRRSVGLAATWLALAVFTYVYLVGDGKWTTDVCWVVAPAAAAVLWLLVDAAGIVNQFGFADPVIAFIEIHLDLIVVWFWLLSFVGPPRLTKRLEVYDPHDYLKDIVSDDEADDTTTLPIRPL